MHSNCTTTVESWDVGLQSLIERNIEFDCSMLTQLRHKQRSTFNLTTVSSTTPTAYFDATLDISRGRGIGKICERRYHTYSTCWTRLKVSNAQSADHTFAHVIEISAQQNDSRFLFDTRVAPLNTNTNTVWGRSVISLALVLQAALEGITRKPSITQIGVLDLIAAPM
jgi:hypothetical protein